ncbi:growth hormone receptor-like [Paramisgurnus dabryanus]|uniref:growth hormone receptor-like n=1 Tax=Paramisgurnus dabryanus TaxID=90735 RepID=UPI0031F3C3D4
MMQFLLMTLHWMTVSASLQQWTPAATGPLEDVIRLNVSKCRSPNMEDFTCQWTPLDSEENITYTFIYKIGDGVAQECPDYVTGGPNTCYFDSKHTQVWEVYCLNVTAHTRTGPITSPKYCLDVVDIVETDPPFNLTYSILNKTDDESSNIVLVSWLYPIASHVNGGWITLEYELRYRQLSDPDRWKVKQRLQFANLELLDLPVGSYEVMVRCRSTKSKLWSRWSDSIYFTITTGRLPVHVIVFMLVTAIAVMTFLIVGIGVIPRGKSIKAYLLSPIPKPRIHGLDPMLIKKGKIDEINHHFSSFHGYKSPQYCIETWYQVNVDASPAVTLDNFLSYYKQEDRVNGTAFPQHQPLLQTNVEEPSQNPAGASQTQPELMSFPGTDYTMILNSDPAAIQPAHQDFYTCVSEIAPTGVVRLVPCLPDALKNTPYLQFKNEPNDDDSDKSVQLAALLKKQMKILSGLDDAGETEQIDSAVPSPPHSADQN